MSNVPTTTLTDADFTDGAVGILDLMVLCKLAPSKKEARRLIDQRGVEVNGDKVEDATVTYQPATFDGDGMMIKKGKKIYHRIQR